MLWVSFRYVYFMRNQDFHYDSYLKLSDCTKNYCKLKFLVSPDSRNNCIDSQ